MEAKFQIKYNLIQPTNFLISYNFLNKGNNFLSGTPFIFYLTNKKKRRRRKILSRVDGALQYFVYFSCHINTHCPRPSNRQTKYINLTNRNNDPLLIRHILDLTLLTTISRLTIRTPSFRIFKHDRISSFNATI